MEPKISCDVNTCDAVRLHFSRRRRGRNEPHLVHADGDVDDYRLDILCQIHSYFIHSMDITKLNRIERAQIEEELKSNDDDHDEMEREQMKRHLMTKKLQQKSMKMMTVIGESDNFKFVTGNDEITQDTNVQQHDDERVEIVYDDEVKESKEHKLKTYDSTIWHVDAAEVESLGWETNVDTAAYDQMDEHQILQKFMEMTRTDEQMAVDFLKNSDWNLQDAFDQFQRYPNEPNRISLISDEKSLESQDDDAYTEGVRFWYWDQDRKPKSAISVKMRHFNLKEEVLDTGLVGTKSWDRFVSECEAFIGTKLIRQKSANGVGADIYGIAAGDEFAIRFLLALKLYTDFDRLNKMFCEHFRLKKLTENTVESVRSLAIRNGRFWHLAKLLMECVQCFGQLLVSRKKRYYRGVGKELNLKRFIARFHVPLSTSKSVCTYIYQYIYINIYKNTYPSSYICP